MNFTLRFFLRFLVKSHLIARSVMLLIIILLCKPASAQQEDEDSTNLRVVSEGKIEKKLSQKIEQEVPPQSKEGKNKIKDQFTTKTTEKREISFGIPGRVDGIYTYLSDIQLSSIEEEGREEEEIIYKDKLRMNHVGGVRLRLAPQLNIGDKFKFVMEGDVLYYPFGQSPEGVEQSSDLRIQRNGGRGWENWLYPRNLYVEFMPFFGVIRAGLMGSQWGMGIVANDGKQKNPFGIYWKGDTVIRLLVATKPFFKSGGAFKDLIVAIAGDLVFDDGVAKIYEGDMAWQGVGALRWDIKKQTFGLYLVYRNQTKDDGRWLKAYVIDGYTKLTMDFNDATTGYFEGEFAQIMGKSNFAYSIKHPEGHFVRQTGLAAKVGIKYLSVIDFYLETGYSSGDSNTNDSFLRQFKFDPGHTIGLIVFPEVLAWQSARASSLAANDELTGYDLPGIELIPTEGAVAGAFYLNPVFLTHPLQWLELNVGCVIARASSPMVSPWEQKSKGYPTGYLGGDAKNKNLGIELDGAIWFHIPLKYIKPIVGAEGGYFWPGNYFKNDKGTKMDDVWLVSARAKIIF